LNSTVNKIIQQLEQRKFRDYSSAKGKAVQAMYRFFPKISLLVLKRNRKKIIEMD